MGRHWCAQDLIRADLKPVNSIQTVKKPPPPTNFHASSMRTSSSWSKGSKSTFSKPFHSSSFEVIPSLAATTRWGGRGGVRERSVSSAAVQESAPSNLNLGGPTGCEGDGGTGTSGRDRPAEVGSAAGDCPPPPRGLNVTIQMLILHLSLIVQEELNSSDCGWALLVTESDPQVLSCLLCTWLDRLKVTCV